MGDICAAFGCLTACFFVAAHATRRRPLHEISPDQLASREIYLPMPAGTEEVARRMPPAAREKGELVSPVRCRRAVEWVTPNPNRRAPRAGGGDIGYALSHPSHEAAASNECGETHQR